MTEGKPFSIPGDPECARCGCPDSRHLRPGPVPGMRPCAGGCKPHCESFLKLVREIDEGRIEHVNHPTHYGGDQVYEAIKIVEALGWGEGFNRGNALKYLLRAGKKPSAPERRDLEKAIWYLQRELERLG